MLRGLEIDGDAFAFPVAVADRFWPFGAAKFGGGSGVWPGIIWA